MSLFVTLKVAFCQQYTPVITKMVLMNEREKTAPKQIYLDEYEKRIYARPKFSEIMGADNEKSCIQKITL